MSTCCQIGEQNHKHKIHKYSAYKAKSGRKYIVAESPSYPKSAFMYLVEEAGGKQLDQSFIDDAVRMIKQDVQDLGVIEYVEMDPEVLVFFMNNNIKVNKISEQSNFEYIDEPEDIHEF